METLNIIQKSPEWHAVRAQSYTSSEASAMLGLSPYMTRSELLQQKSTGISKEVDSATQRRFDDGHAAEAAARPVVEARLGDELYPVTGRLVVDGLPLLASFDGVTMTGETIWENKLSNKSLETYITDNADLPETHWPQVEHALLVSGASECYFTVSNGTEEGTVGLSYKSRSDRRARLIAGWKQFAEDLKTYKHVEIVEAPKADAIETLPAIFVQVEGRVVASNLADFKESASRWIEAINMNPETDQDFANAEQRVKDCETAEKRLDAAKDQILAQTASIDEVFRTIDAVKAALRNARLSLDKAVTRKKDSIRADIVAKGREELAAYIQSLNEEIGMQLVPAITADFAGAIKGKRNMSSVHEAVGVELANRKIEANEVAARIRINLKAITESGHDFLFTDIAQICTRDTEHFALLLKSRIDAYKVVQEEKRKREEVAAAKVEEVVPVQAPIASVVQITQPTQSAQPTLRLGKIAERIGFSLTADQLRAFGIHPAGKDKMAVLYHESDFTRICDALIAHIEAAKLKKAA